MLLFNLDLILDIGMYIVLAGLTYPCHLYQEFDHKCFESSHACCFNITVHRFLTVLKLSTQEVDKMTEFTPRWILNSTESKKKKNQ